MTIFKKQYIDNKEVIFDAGNMAYNFSFVIACRYELYRCPKTFLECEKSVVKPWDRDIGRETANKSNSVNPPKLVLYI